MKIALLAPVAWRTPPRKYGPWEQVVSVLAEGLVAAGMDVHLFATGDSETAGQLHSVVPEPYAEFPARDAKVDECLHISALMERADEFDVIHNHFDFLPLTYSRLIKTPVVTTIHGFSSPRILPVYRKYNDHVSYVSISNSDRDPSLTYTATVYNGIDSAQFDFVAEPADHLLFFGRIHPEKGTAEAIRVAKKAKRKIIIAGLIQDQEYYDREVAPFINDDDVVYAGNCGPSERNRLLGNAAALLHLISFDEPFGLSVAESMCCGTPVIAFNRGSMPELILQGETGFLVKTEEEAVSAIEDLNKLDRAFCREHALNNFSQEKMTRDYIAVYKKLIAR